MGMCREGVDRIDSNSFAVPFSIIGAKCGDGDIENKGDLFDPLQHILCSVIVL